MRAADGAGPVDGCIIADGFGDQAWFDAWYEAFAPALPRHRVNLPAGILTPELMEGSVRLLRRSFRFLRAPVNSHTPRYGWRLPETTSASELGRLLRDALRRSRCHGVELSLLAENGLTLRRLRQLATDGGWVASVDEQERTPIVNTTGDWEAYRASRSANVTKTLNWKENRLRREGHFVFQEVGGGPNWETWLDRALDLETRGWKGRQGSAILQHPNEARFYRQVAKDAAGGSRLRLFVATLDKDLIAFQLLLAEHERLFLLKLAYKEELASLSPGSVLQRLVLRDCFVDPKVRTVDLAGPGEWKLRWATDIERLLRVRLAPSVGLAGWLLRLESALRRLRHRVSRTRASNELPGTTGSTG